MGAQRLLLSKREGAKQSHSTAAHRVCADSSCAERDEWHYCLSRALPEDYKTQALAAFHHSVEVSRDRPTVPRVGPAISSSQKEDKFLLSSGPWQRPHRSRLPCSC